MFGIFDKNDGFILEHHYGSLHGAVRAANEYGNNHNLYVFEHDGGTLLHCDKPFKQVIQSELISRNIR